MAAGDTATVFLETTLGTRLVVSFPAGATTVADLKGRVSAEHATCFPRTGPIAVTSLQVKLDGSWFQLTDSMAVRDAFEWVKGPWRLLAEAHELRSHPLARKDAKCETSDAEPSAGRPVISDNSTQMQYLMPPAGSQGGGSLASGDGVSDTPQINQQDNPQEGDEHASGQGKDETTMPQKSSDLDLAAGDRDTLLPNQEDKPQECVEHASGQIEDGIAMPQESSDIDSATGDSGTSLANQEDKPQECVEHDSGQLEDGITMPQESSDIDLTTGDSGTPLANQEDKPQECVEHASGQLEDGISMPQKSSDFDLVAGYSDAPPMNQQDKSHDAVDHASVQSEDKPTMHQESSDLDAAAGRGNGPVGGQQKDIITERRGKKRYREEDKTNESIVVKCGDDLSSLASSTCNAESSEKKSCVAEQAKLNSVPLPYDLEDHSHGLGKNPSGGQKETLASGAHNVESSNNESDIPPGVESMERGKSSDREVKTKRGDKEPRIAGCGGAHNVESGNNESDIPPGVESMERGKSSDREVKTKRGDKEPRIAGCGGESSCKRTDDPHCVESMKEDVKWPVSNSHYLDKGENGGATSNVSIERICFRRRHKRIVVRKVPISKAIKIYPFRC
ncbi:uncharacterized protein LOC120686392 isoform X1 [Panicum virgatum]|uniref:Uncharacterized protein n=2 Tax=Panicum virgatum TaxID=38727 RepID=A0A8T0PGD1_PANVG|nr:uncharacterized protein LOC120686392 isoform X1 [Panicum virgatum]KAG2559230.1 hypothetical protein PVAP13_8NG313300 [Panicum virgatum]KAG2559231.1 hypothetical protein PVAP13_8NG313300 [Panicum virgatum]KAG2559232.1 hypothetical protein PVAP13_8NG313300 [Panicum virgatum]